METRKPKGETFQYIDIDSIDNKTNRIKYKEVKTENAPSRASRKVFKTSTLFSMVRPYLRNIAFVGENNSEAIASTGFYVCTPFDFVSPKYLFLLMKSKYVVDGLNFYMKGDNSPSINGNNIENFLFPIPSKRYQDRIVEMVENIENYLELIDTNINDLLQLVNKAKLKILDSVFREKSSYKSYYGSRTFTTLNKLIPSDKIGDGDWVLSENMDENGEYRIVQLKHIGKGCYVNKPYKRINKNFFENNSCSEIKPNFLLINRLVSEEMDACLLPSFSYKTITSVDVCWIAPDEKYDQKYLMYYLLSPAFQSQVLLKSSGSTRKRISKKNLISIPIQIHNLDDQKMIVKDIEQYFELLNSIIE